MTPDLLRSLLQGTAEAVIAQAEHLTALDQAIGDGDHGINMKRGLENVSLIWTVSQPNQQLRLLKRWG